MKQQTSSSTLEELMENDDAMDSTLAELQNIRVAVTALKDDNVTDEELTSRVGDAVERIFSTHVDFAGNWRSKGWASVC